MATDVLNERFKQGIGRDMNEAERNWLASVPGEKGSQLNNYINGLKNFSQRIISDAQNIYGLKNFTQKDADTLRDSLYIAGDQAAYDTFWDRANATLANRKTEELINPTVDPTKQGEYGQTVTGLFQEYLGRDPKAYELEHFSKQLAQGDDPYILASALQQAPEYLDKQAATQREKMSQELLGYQEQAFAKAQPSIISSFMKAGRLNSSGVTSALAKAQQELESQRQQYLSGISREDYVNNRGKAFDIYAGQTAPSQQRAAALTQQQYSLPFQSGAAINQRGNELSDYYRQQNDFNRYMQMQKDNSRRSAQYGLYGQLLGAGLNAGAMYATGGANRGAVYG